ncbi:hypothetical protein KKH00_02725, partial [Patescibacteria group bacterium]|nr:hypothetical protein [Patescibacteria group bacterium]
MKYNYLLPLFTSLIVFILLETFSSYPKLIYIILILINSIIFFTLWQLIKASKTDKQWWNFLILPALMSSMVIAYSIFLDNKILIQLLFIANTVFLYFYLRCIYHYLIHPQSYKTFSIENISSYGNLLTFFLLASTIYGLQSFLNLPIWILEIVMLIIIFLIIYQSIWANKIDFKKGLPYILVCCLILFELSWPISFLPFNYNIAGLILTIDYYILISLTKEHLLNKLNKKTI